MAENNKKLSCRQRAAIVALMECSSIEKVAKRTGVGERTLYRWLKEPAFQETYQATREAVFGQAIAKLQKVAGLAAAELERIIDSKRTSAGVKVRACHVVLEHAQERADIDIQVRARLGINYGVLVVGGTMDRESWEKRYAEVEKSQSGLKCERKNKPTTN